VTPPAKTQINPQEISISANLAVDPIILRQLGDSEQGITA
jgi:hypothetical protein